MRTQALVALGAALLASAAAADGPGRERLPVAVHVHSDLSTGDRSVEELVKLARAQGLGGLLLTENYLLRAEYGLAPFRALTRVTHELRGVLSTGLDAYLAQVARTRHAHPDLLVLPGVEVIPHQHWSGSPLGLAMTLHDTQKNFLVFGVADAAALRSLPVVGNPFARH